MSTLVNTPFRSKYGFESTGFEVDSLGNISAKSISLVDATEVPDSDLPADNAFSEVGGNFRLSGNATDNPVGTRQDLPGSKLIGFSIKAIKSMPEAPLVLYEGNCTD